MMRHHSTSNGLPKNKELYDCCWQYFKRKYAFSTVSENRNPSSFFKTTIKNKTKTNKNQYFLNRQNSPGNTLHRNR